MLLKIQLFEAADIIVRIQFDIEIPKAINGLEALTYDYKLLWLPEAGTL